MIYLDSAATSLQKPKEVQRAVAEAMFMAASPGRGTHMPAMRAADVCYECRENLARLLGVLRPERIVFTMNATHALNIAIGSVVSEETRVLISGYEHNSVTRPLHHKGVKPTIIDTPLFDQKAFMERLEKEIDFCDTVIINYVSNVFGYILPVKEIARLCRERGKRLIIDASQAAGVLEINAEELQADFIAMPGHKGLLGPQGTGVLVCSGEATPLLFGGSGSQSAQLDMPDYFPDMLEAGTHNVSGIAGLNEGVKYLIKNGVSQIEQHERNCLEQFYRVMSSFDRAKLFYTQDSRMQSSVISIVPEGTTCEQLAERLGKMDIAIRAGLHCAPLAHETAGTFNTGTARFSFSPFISVQDAIAAATVVCEIIATSQK